MSDAPRFATIPDAVAAIARGATVIVVTDDPGRENTGHIVCAAATATARRVNFMATHGRGLICCAVSSAHLQRLSIPPMAGVGDQHGAALHVGIDHRNAGTGISARDRAAAARALADPNCVARDLRMPGHLFPLAAHQRGVLGRPAHPEASVDLTRLAGLPPAGLICDITDASGEMARLPQLRILAGEHDMPIVGITDLVRYRRAHEQQLVSQHGEARLPLRQGDFRIIGYRDVNDGREYVALLHGDLRAVDDPLVRIHYECPVGDVFGAQICGCGAALQNTLAQIASEPAGILIYVRSGQPSRFPLPMAQSQGGGGSARPATPRDATSDDIHLSADRLSGDADYMIRDVLQDLGVEHRNDQLIPHATVIIDGGHAGTGLPALATA